MGTEELLANAPLFSGFGSAELKRLARALYPRRHQAGEVILNEGEEAAGLYIVSSGQVEVVKDLGGPKETVLATLGEGDFFGETALLDGYPRTASIRALGDVECLVMTRWDFLAELKSKPDMAVQALRTLARRLRQTDARLTE
jgi:CRP/FNR family cyclic AMP-dependent transcriptional regulator